MLELCYGARAGLTLALVWARLPWAAFRNAQERHSRARECRMACIYWAIGTLPVTWISCFQRELHMARKCLTYIDRGVRFQGPSCPGEHVFGRPTVVLT